MKVIALCGPANSGKSHTINIAYQLLLRDGFAQVPGYFQILGNPKFEDVYDILEKTGIRVGICGMGDYQRGGGSLKNLLLNLESQGCNISICGCQSKPAILNAVTNYPSHHLVPKTMSTGSANDRIVNGIDAYTVFNLI